ncbi:hypothetical protein H2199_002358 [Coniosporium tulheliwenetii]|uniref:Uncharacterized protein n=1 Tax=Coniosporium tulheliwenetii TaxID=3383036 RepID=A0ACC2ZIK0_9PEZI|nr:hypothetical protein H2199_002358 [Cladosporium sp. JES 115]
MQNARIIAAAVALSAGIVLLPLQIRELAMFLKSYFVPLLLSFGSNVRTLSPSAKVDLEWHAPRSSWINNLDSVIEGDGVHGFIFNSSHLPQGVPYGTYNWCNMPHVRAKEYSVADEKYELDYVEVIHRHHKRTPYASNTFPQEAYPWYCSDEGLFFYGKTLGNATKSSAATYWSVYTTDTNPFAPSGFNGTCQFPQITREGLEDSWQHGKDLYGVYHDLLRFLPDSMDGRVTYRVTNNVITSQVAGMLVEGMYSPDSDVPLLIQPDSVDSLEPSYACAPASSLYSSYGVGSNRSNWTAHLSRSASLFSALDSISGVPPDYEGFHRSFDHYFDNLSARQCHAKPLPCKIGVPSDCVTQEQANAVYRLGQYEYSYIYRDAPESLQAARN